MAANYLTIFRKPTILTTVLLPLFCNIFIAGNPLQQIVFHYLTDQDNKTVTYQASSDLQDLAEDTVNSEPSTHFKKAENIISSSQVYYANEQGGTIGKLFTADSENPYDNFFTVNLPLDIDLERYDAVLAYDLYGLQKGSQTTKSINNHIAYGGKSIASTQEWTSVEENIADIQLQGGQNEIFFNRREADAYQYKIKNLRIELVQKKAALFLIENTITNSGGNIYLAGTVADNSITAVESLGINIPVTDGIFEHVFKDVPAGTEEISITYSGNDGEKKLYKFPVKYESGQANVQFENKAADFTNNKIYAIGAKNCIEYDESLNITTANHLVEGFLAVEGLYFKDVRTLDADLYNVTAGKFHGYRVKKQNLADSVAVELHLKYDEQKIPAGYTAKDIKTFYFDKTQKTWKALPVDSLDLSNSEIITTAYNNDTDYINGVIKIPESPETGNFTPTTISDMKFADPAAGIVSIAPPTPNSTGAAATSFPIKLPQGRNGMQPSLGVSYNSEAGNGWMGIGWNLNTPAISLNTNWGVPVFDDANESEIYSLSGADLVLKDGAEYTNPHRKANISRLTDRQFYQRKEGSYQKIIRHGSNPENYWWEVTDKMGNKSYYGGYTGTGLDNDAVIKTSNGKIAHWALKRVQDPYGNYMEYSYAKPTADAIGGITPQKFYVDKICYTMYGSINTTYYKVEFKRNAYTVGSSTTSLQRKDIITSARNGYLSMIDDLLTEIKISFVQPSATTLIRTYRFDYEEKDFDKQQLVKVSEYDADNDLFYTNTLEYYDEVEDGQVLSTTPTEWAASSGNDSVLSALENLTGVPITIIPKGTPLGTSASSGSSLALRTGVGIGGDFMSVANTIGGSLSQSRGTQNGRVSFIDINGDGLPDKVYEKNGVVSYRPNLGQNQSGVEFGFPYQIEGIDQLSETKSNTRGWGFDGNLMGQVGAGKSWSRTSSSTDSYFTDFNGDGLPDMITGGRVKFNTTGGGGNLFIRNFTNTVTDSENTIVPGPLDGGFGEQLMLPTMAELCEEYPQFDHVKVWKAPFDGEISISSIATLLQKNTYTDNPANDFRLTIERTNFSVDTVVEESETLTDLNAPENINATFEIEKDDVLFFRIHNLGYGLGGEVEWNPVITYTGIDDIVIPTFKDDNEKNIHVFNAKNDFMVNNGGSVAVNPTDSTVSVAFNLAYTTYDAYEFSDNIKFKVKKTRIETETGDIVSEDEWEMTYVHILGTVLGNDPTFLIGSPAPAGEIDFLYFYAESTSNVDWSRISWKPTITGSVTGVTYPPVNYHTYDDNLNQEAHWFDISSVPDPTIIDSNDEETDYMQVSHTFFEQDYSYVLDSFDDEQFPLKINWIVKKRVSNVVSTVMARTFYLYRTTSEEIFPGITAWDYIFTKVPVDDPLNITNPSDVIDLNIDTYFYQKYLNKKTVKDILDSDGNIFSAFYVDNKEIGSGNSADIILDMHPDFSTVPFTPVQLDSPFFGMRQEFHGLSYRGWGQFLYNGGLKFDRDEEGEITNQTPTDYGADVIDEELFDIVSIGSNVEDVEGMSIEEIEASQSAELRYALYDQINEINSYKNETIKDAVYAFNSDNKLTAKVGRFAEPVLQAIYIDPDEITNSDAEIEEFFGLKQYSRSKGKAKTGNLSLVEGTESEATSEVLLQYMDVNGDRYPDIVTGGKIQYTNMMGTPSGIIDNDDFRSGDKSIDRTVGVTLPGLTPNSTDTKVTPNKTNTNISSGINTSTGSSFDSKMWLDINGDGLPDKVKMVSEESQPNLIKVRLNVGYGFSEDITWGSFANQSLTSSTRRNNGAGLGAGNNFPGGASFAAGFGASASTARMQTTFNDVNGDGLPDLLVRTADGAPPQYSYYLNTGQGFTDSPVTFFNGNIEEDYTVAGNIYGTVTWGWPLPVPFIPVKVVLSPSLGGNASFNEKRITIQDINGDGLSEVLTYNSFNNNSLSARLNTVGKTHLLKKVNTPLGGSWEITYTRNGNTYEMPQSKWVLTTITTHDGFETDNDLNMPVTFTKATYQGPNYDRRERQFLGYGAVLIEQRDPTNLAVNYRYVVNLYHNSNYYLSGAEAASKLYNGAGELLSETTTLYNILDPDAPVVNFEGGSIQSSLIPQADALLDRSRLFVAPIRITSTVYEGNESLTSVKAFTAYDVYGNVTAYLDEGTGPEDAFRTTILYYTSLTDVDNAVGYPRRIRTYKNSDNTLVRDREAEYNPYKGKLSRVITKLDPSNATEVHRVAFMYDVYGNLTRVTEPDKLFNSVAYRRDYTYDAVVHTYPIKVTNSYGEQSDMAYEYLFGTQVYMKDTNNQEMRTRIDDRGRLVEVTGPNEMAIPGGNGWTIRTDYKGEDVMTTVGTSVYMTNAVGAFEAVAAGTENPENSQHHAVTRHYDPEIHSGSTPTNQFLTVSIVDGFGQPVQVKKSLFSGNTMKFQVGGIQAKDAFGRVIRSYDPKIQASYPMDPNVLSTAHTTYISAGLPELYTSMEYDEKDRVTKVIQPGETAEATIAYSIEDGLFAEKRTNEKSQTLDTYKDIRGRQVKTVQNSEITTTFEYNAINELTSVINNEGAKTNYFYDFAGRKTEVQHPDRGITTFKYDKVNRLTEMKTSNLLAAGLGEKITYQYEYNRLVQINYPQNPHSQVKYTYGKKSDPMAVAERAVGRLFTQEDATGVQVLGYGRMGEVTKQLRSVAVADYHAFWFQTQWKYDSWNRVQEIRYPDQEVVSYTYNKAGMLRKITSAMDIGLPNDGIIVEDIAYNDFGERERIEYGNGTFTDYTYDDRHRMNVLEHTFDTFHLKKNYGYDVLSNITSIATDQPGTSLPAAGALGGPVNHLYEYDTYNRLEHAEGNYTGPNDLTTPYLQQAYELDMTYNTDHTINSKTQIQTMGTVNSYGGTTSGEIPVYKNSYDLVYDDYATGAYAMEANPIHGEYGYRQPHAVRTITETPTWVSGLAPDDPRIKHKEIKYDANGNQTEIKEKVGEEYTSLRKNLWDEENRLIAVDLKPDDESDHPIAIYTYDAGGERTIRYNLDHIDVSSNADEVGQTENNNVMLYPSGLLMAKAIRLDEKENVLAYTKHYYIGSERVSAKTGTMRQLGGYDGTAVTAIFPTVNMSPIIATSNASVDDADTAAIAIYNKFGVTHSISSIADPENCDFTHNDDEGILNVYYIHSDHLGSSSYITDTNQKVIQHVEYLPFGETMVDEHSNSFNSPFKFNGKEFDEETGNYYYSARYYDPKWSIFISVDPMAEKYPEKTPYHYCSSNPLNRIDPDGKDDFEINSNGMIVNRIENKKADNFYMVDDDGNRIEGKSISFKYGTIISTRSEKAEYMKRNEDGTTEKAVTDVDIYKIRGDKNGTKLFEFVADNTNVEWSDIKTGVEGNKGLNFLTTGHIEYTEPGGTALLNGQLQHGYTLRELNHNHPGDVPYPSGIPGFTGDTGDVPFAKQITDFYQEKYKTKSSPSFNIYNPTDKTYIPYSKNSKKSDFRF